MKYIVRPGDCLSSISARHGMQWETIWNDGKNAQLKNTRKNPNVLYPGDVLYIPDKKQKQVSAASNQRHRFKTKKQSKTFRLRLLINDQAMANAEYALELDGNLIPGKTDGSGWLEQKVAPSVKKGKLVLTKSAMAFKIKFGYLDPVDQSEGAQQRLANLGFYAGKKIASKTDRHTEVAVAAFQKYAGLKASGTLDTNTESSLEKKHGI